ncbi:ABC transporter substrate-binding protein [Seonamhaeicola algicola]|uniref:ABC transporter substrate-binding protein n=2 Tax=Seonamhaeicola TaxID=1649495 RepID=A0A5C7AMT3_9FLAO|nr:ABC transporter substrate-binding protein [Seonamhaeicola algicola]TXE10066.1 ABC transporter substrate-binding protein [Seonamhaeicola algicola]
MKKRDKNHIKTLRTSLITLIVFTLLCCKNEPKQQLKETLTGTKLQLKYASGFSCKNYGSYKVLQITKSWPNASKTYKYIIISKENAAKTSFLKDEYDGIILTPIEKLVATSTTHIPALELLNVENSLVGFPQTNFISSEKIRHRIDEGFVKDIGKNESINTEILLELNPNLIISFGIEGGNKTIEAIKKTGIPVIYNGDWAENSPLAKAEWIKFFGVLFNKVAKADSIFNTIETNYIEAKNIAAKAETKPTILSGAMHSDIWYLPNGTSTEAQLLKDANVNYLWANTTGSGSLKLNFEAVFNKAQQADIWLNPSNYTSLQNLENGSLHHTKFKAFQNKSIYTVANTTGATGGVLYYELGFTRPDWVLKDIIKICHPELLTNYTPHFLKKLP